MILYASKTESCIFYWFVEKKISNKKYWNINMKRNKSVVTRIKLWELPIQITIT